MENQDNQQGEFKHSFPPPPPPPNAPVRPPVLTVFLVLSFIGAGFALISGIFSLMFYAVMPDMAYEMNMPDPNYGVLAGGFLFSIGKLVGAMQMWKMKKIGFMIYTICEIGAAIIGAVTTMSTPRDQLYEVYDQLGMGSGFVDGIFIVTIGFSFVVSAVFIIIYGVQSRKMS